MKDKITQSEIEELDKVYHALVVSMQKTSEELWNDKLQGISTVEVSILSIIERKPDVILKEITQFLGVPASTLTNAIDRLEKRGLLIRVISKRDRRSFGLALTEDGELAQQEHKQSEALLWQRILGAYDTFEERSEFVRLLSILAEKLAE
jgi:DNA-binding MarR family transcriptional regulator